MIRRTIFFVLICIAINSLYAAQKANGHAKQEATSLCYVQQLISLANTQAQEAKKFAEKNRELKQQQEALDEQKKAAAKAQNEYDQKSANNKKQILANLSKIAFPTLAENAEEKLLSFATEKLTPMLDIPSQEEICQELFIFLEAMVFKCTQETETALKYLQDKGTRSQDLFKLKISEYPRIISMINCYVPEFHHAWTKKDNKPAGQFTFGDALIFVTIMSVAQHRQLTEAEQNSFKPIFAKLPWQGAFYGIQWEIWVDHAQKQLDKDRGN